MARLITRQEASELLECTPQTISNWVEKGLINGHVVGRVVMIDRNSITKYLDTAKDVVILEKKLISLKKELMNDIEKYGNDIKDLKDTLECPGVPIKIYRTFMLSLIKISKHILSDKELDIITRLIKGNKLEAIAEIYGYSNYRILQIGLYSTQKIQFGAELQNIESQYSIKLHQAGAEFPLPFALVPWRHHVEIINKCETVEKALFYVGKTIELGQSSRAS